MYTEYVSSNSVCMAMTVHVINDIGHFPISHAIHLE
jgi:hypothetical protein